jgi:hypothetical protein
MVPVVIIGRNAMPRSFRQQDSVPPKRHKVAQEKETFYENNIGESIKYCQFHPIEAQDFGYFEYLITGRANNKKGQ